LEFINNIATAYYITLTDPPLPCPNFDMPGSDKLIPAVPLNMAFFLDNFKPLSLVQYKEFDSSDNILALSQPLPLPST
jgi:hypothetical protein